MSFNLADIRAQFPVLDQQVNGKPLVYLDNGATTQKPNVVIDAICDYYRHDNANVHRGAHALSDRATGKFEAARESVRRFINAADRQEIIWTKGTTEGINLVAFSWGREHLRQGDRVLVSTMEHHANIVPWQLLAGQTGCELVPMPVDDQGQIDLAALDDLLDERVKLVSVVHVSNALGTVNPVESIVEKAHAVGAKVLIDGAQAVAHWPLNVQALDCDFYSFSAHKMYGPTGMGALYGKRELLEAMPPFMGGGEMIETVSFAGTTYNTLPYKFEPGTPNIAGAIGMGAAVEFLESQDRVALAAHETDVLNYAVERAQSYDGLRLVGEADHRAGVLSFLLDGAHPADIGMLLDQQGIAVRTGNHCAMPVMERFGITGTVRASFALYNSRDDVDALFAGLDKVKTFLL
ncbi:cysteine sulfinate desulfinase [Saccharospirillum sp. MSK14-1]|uniref:aminotransferase class V-fold PLP-dependent enzyme n=1 Tax=Saccharospirillum sp. MSK14-1 TaxID=1897632 RepID=UPI000D393147|nr:cysteine desulfurase [Saccharospirillum sp. MSK14-1]PTY36085.1 cysteine sulfinate desulfinase [Saccharospirillum sp. MSK14-1]